MKILKTILMAGGASVILAVAAQAADLPTKKAPAAAPKANCLADFYSWLYASPTDCPLTFFGVTAYGAIDIGGGYQTDSVRMDKYASNPSSIIVGPQSRTKSGFVWAPNQWTASYVGLKITEHLAGDFDLIGDWRFGFNPLSLHALDGEHSLIENNGVATALRTNSGSSSWNGAIDNNRAWIGAQSPTYGTFKFGRINNFANDYEPGYDATGLSDFSVLGYSGGWGTGLGITETNRYNLGASYVYDYKKLFHIGANAALGGYSTGNDAKQLYSFDAGASYNGFSFDAIYQHATDALKVGAYTSLAKIATAGADATQDLTATLANQDAIALLAKYNYQSFTVYGTYSYARLSNPSDTTYPKGWQNVLGSDYNVLGTGSSGTVNVTNYPRAQILQVATISGKYSVNPSLDLEATYGHIWQNCYDTAAKCPADSLPVAGYVGAASGKASGHVDSAAFVVDYRPIKRLDVYGGVVFSKGTGGLVSGYNADHNTTFDLGLRFAF